MTNTTYTMTAHQTALYDSDDDRDIHRVLDEITSLLGPRNDYSGRVEVKTADGVLVGRWDGK